MGSTDYKKIIILIIILVVLIFAAVQGYKTLSSDYSNSQLGQDLQLEEQIKKATNFTVYTADGEKVRMLDYKGKPIVVNFWATWCGPCKVELPAFEDLYQQYGEQVQFMMVNLTDGLQEKKEDVQGFVSSRKYTFPVFFDTQQTAYDLYNLQNIPKTIFVDKNGNLIYSHTGAMSKSLIEQYIKYLIGE